LNDDGQRRTFVHRVGEVVESSEFGKANSTIDSGDVERKEVFRERAGGLSVERVSYVENVVDKLIREERKSIDLRGGRSNFRISGRDVEERVTLTLCVIS